MLVEVLLGVAAATTCGAIALRRTRTPKASIGYADLIASSVAAYTNGETTPPAPASFAHLPTVRYEEDDDRGTETRRADSSSTLPTIPVLYDFDAIVDEPTRAPSFALASAACSDRGRRRPRNEDSFAFSSDLGLFIVADGMGGHRGGDVASDLAVQVIGDAFKGGRFDGRTHASLPPRASKLARAIQMANRSIRNLARARAELAEMGTTVVAALFSPETRRLYIGHVGDSRCYRLRDGRMEQMTEDHTMATLGVSGPTAGNLARSVGTSGRVVSDIVIAEPKIGDVYLLCSDGLPKMVSDDAIRSVLEHAPAESVAASHLVQLANEKGGLDNITALVIRVLPVGDATVKARIEA